MDAMSERPRDLTRLTAYEIRGKGSLRTGMAFQVVICPARALGFTVYEDSGF